MRGSGHLVVSARRPLAAECRGSGPGVRPVSPVTVKRAGRVSHFAVPDDRHVAVLIECQPIVGGEHPPVPLVRAPVALDDPGTRFTGVPVARPSREFQVQPVVQALEDGLANARVVVIALARNHQVEQPDQIRLPGGFVVSDDRAELGIVTPDGILCHRRDIHGRATVSSPAGECSV